MCGRSVIFGLVGGLECPLIKKHQSPHYLLLLLVVELFFASKDQSFITFHTNYQILILIFILPFFLGGFVVKDLWSFFFFGFDNLHISFGTSGVLSSSLLRRGSQERTILWSFSFTTIPDYS